MKNSKIDFPYYFEGNQKFKSIDIESKAFVQYSHNNNQIQDILLKIHQPFILYVKQGTVILSCKNKVWHVQPNESVIINRGQYIMSEDLSEQDNFDALLFFMNPHFITHLEEKNSDIVEIFRSDIDVFPLRVNSYIKNYIQTFSLLFEEQSSLLNEDDFLELKSKEFLYYLEKNSLEKFDDMYKAAVDDENEKLKEVVENKWNEHSVKELAFLACMSESKFKRRFQELYNSTPGTWIRTKKLQEAKNRLTHTDIKIYLLADDLGFKDAKYFSKLFKETYGLSPAEYREQLIQV